LGWVQICLMKQKQIKKIKPEDELSYIPIDVFDCITIEDIKKEYAKHGDYYNDEQATKIKALLEQLMEIFFYIYQLEQKKKQATKTIEINIENEKSHFIHKSEYRRAS
jgi:hypothetical protein